MSTIIQLRRGSAAEASNLLGFEGELFLDLDNQHLRYHDGSQLGGYIIGRNADTLSGYNITDAYTQSEVDGLLSGKPDLGTTLSDYGIADAYTQTEIDSIVSVSNRGIESEGSITSVSTLDTGISVTGDFVPSDDSNFDLGSSDNAWRDLYLSGNTIYFGDETLSAFDGKISVNNVEMPNVDLVDQKINSAVPVEFQSNYKPLELEALADPISNHPIGGTEILIDYATYAWAEDDSLFPSDFEPSLYSYTIDGSNFIDSVSIVSANSYGVEAALNDANTISILNTDNMFLVPAGTDITDPSILNGVISNAVPVNASVISKSIAPSTIEAYGIGNAYTIDEVDNAITSAVSGKFNTPATLTVAGFGITDVYTRDEIDTLISGAFKTTPTAQIGSSGDTEGDIAQDANYLYVCTADYDGVSNIWKRIAWDTGSW